ncbi:metallophosphoesterase family protein [Floricoccus penangensis]|uniref:metallophosphoesterase family protein n=1 Tax=Floricoccus penangensis TaxID=1859475 RepID=UPI00203E25BF|nr:metallophosphoesterase family protein [Floricoccus penangensis]URZ86970.1 metallophosphoesterase family protein [Floricoccus penangensis]
MNHKIGIISDIHGNFTALKAVIEDAKKSGMTEYWLLGDIVLPGPGANDMMAYLSELPITYKVKGNWDDVFLDAIDNKYSVDSPIQVYFMRLSQYLKENLDARYIDKLRNLPMFVETKINDISTLICHNLPDKNYGRDLTAEKNIENFDKLFELGDYDLAVYAHVHTPMVRYASDGQVILNPGTIGQHTPWKRLNKDLRAQYAILEIDDLGIENIQLKKVWYDIEEELKIAKKSNLPYFNLYKEILEQGITHTEDSKFINKINIKEGYLADVKEYFNF